MNVTDKMVSAAMPWLTNWQHMRATDRRAAMRSALVSALAEAADGALEASRRTTPPQLSEPKYSTPTSETKGAGEP